MKKLTRRDFLKQGGVYAGAAALAASGLGSLRLFARETGFKRVYILNIDGMPARYLGAKYQGVSVTPNLDALMARGTSFSTCLDVLPALTATNHTEIVSSAPTSKSGILGAGGYYKGIDDKGNPILKLYEKKHCLVETVYDSIKRELPNRKTAVLSGKNWIGVLLQGDPASPVADILVNGKSYPSYIKPPEGYIFGGPAKEGDDHNHIRFQVAKPGDKIEKGCVGGLTTIEHFPKDDWIIDAAIEVVKREDPVFMYALLADIDDSGHLYGSFNDTVECTIGNFDAGREQMGITDAAVGRFIKFLKDTDRLKSSIVVVTADHGMTTMEEHYKIDIGGFKNGVNPGKVMEMLSKTGDLSVDIRGILAKSGFPIRVSDGVTKFNPNGVYDTTLTEGPNTYLYRADKDALPKMKQALLDWNKSTKHKPIWKVLLPDDMRDGVNEYDGLPFRLMCDKYYNDPKAPVVWPNMIVYTHQHYMSDIHSDVIRSGTVFVMRRLPLPPGVKIKIIPGTHGGYAEQKVPLIMVGEGFKPGATVSRKVSVLDILPTLCKVTGLPLPKDAVGTSLV